MRRRIAVVAAAASAAFAAVGWLPERQIEQPPIDPVAERIADELLAELIAEGGLHPLEGTVMEGIQEPQQVFGRGIWSFHKAWIGVNAHETLELKVYAGSLADDSSVGVVYVQGMDLVNGDGVVLVTREYLYPGHGGGFRVESEHDRVLTFSRWIDNARQPGTVRFDVVTGAFR